MILLFAVIPFVMSGRDGKTSEPEGTFFSRLEFGKNFHLNSPMKAEHSLLFFDGSGTAEMLEKTGSDMRRGIFSVEADKNRNSTSESKKVKSKKLGRAVLINAGLWLSDSIRYWSMYAGWVEDWQFELNWKDQKRRFFSFEANKFDSNPFCTNWAHGLSGAIFFTMARYHRLNTLESVLFGMTSSLFWEYVTEWREVVSVNDNFFSGIGGMPIGETLHRLGHYLNSKPGTLNKVFGYIVNPVMGLNDLLGGKKWRRHFARPEFEILDGGIYFSNKQVSFKGDKKWSSPYFHIGIETTYNTIPGYGKPDDAGTNRFINKPLISEFNFDLSYRENVLDEYIFFTKVVLFGHFNQKIRQTSAKKLKGHSLYFGAGSAFELFKKKATAYYDKGEYHYDFTGGEQATQPTEFTDKWAIINLIGPVFDLSLYSGPFKFGLSLGAYLDFGMIQSMAINKYSTAYDIYEPRMKTTLTHYGYHYAFGYTLSGGANLSYRNIELKGKLKYQYYDSVEGLDRFWDDVVDDCNVTDSVLMYKVSAGYSIPNSPLQIIFAFEGLEREGAIKEISHRETEARYYTQLKLSF